MFHCGLVYCGKPSCFISRGEYSSNQRIFLAIVEKHFNLSHEITVQMDTQLCSMKTYDVYQNNKSATDLEKFPLVDLRLVRKSNAKINEKQKIW